MIRLARRFGSLGRADRRLIVEATALLFLTRVGLRRCRFAMLRRLLDRAARRQAEPFPSGSADRAIRIRWAIEAATRHLPGRTTCLADALAADVMLRRRGLESSLHLGVESVRRAGERLNAHAWVESGGTKVTGEIETLSAYVKLTPATVPAEDALSAVLRGEDVDWRTLGERPADVVDLCVRHDLAGLVCERLRRRCDTLWPEEILNGLADELRGQTAAEALRRRELAGVLDALAADNVHPILFKGAALAYQLYESPAARPRTDVDLLVRRSDVDRIRQTLGALGYLAPPYCDGDLLFCQFELARRDGFGVDHVFDFHWKISTQVVFADVLGYEDLVSESIEVPALGRHARAAGPVHALLLACIHPVMHHRNQERLLWIYDVHLLASRLQAAEMDRFVAVALETRVAAVCADQLRLARARFGTKVSDLVLDALSTPLASEPSAEYLPHDRRWRHEIVASMRGLPRWRDRLQLAREVLLPSRQYMLAAYDLSSGVRGAALLPALYVHRALYGAWKILIGRK